MAFKALKYELARAIPSGDSVNSTLAALNSAMATLQAQGAAPTEAQVDITDTALIAHAASYATGVTIIMETTCTQNQLRAILEDALRRLP